jgi:short-subunit dehydrogenase
MNDLNGKVVVITGASSGIGAASAHLLAAQGCKVILIARRLDRLNELADEIKREGGTAISFQVDLADLEEIHSVAVKISHAVDQVDILVNNAGFGRLLWLEDLDLEKDIGAMVYVNLLGTIYLTRLLLPGMISRKQGHIINLASVASFIGTPTYTVYAATKFAIRGFSEALRREVNWWGIKVSAIYPGGVDTEFMEHTGRKRKPEITTPNWLLMSADEVARTVLKVAKRPRRMVLMPWPMILAVWANALFPGIIDWVVKVAFVKRERQDNLKGNF